MPLLEVFHPLGRIAMIALTLGLAGCLLIGMEGLTVLIHKGIFDPESEEDDPQPDGTCFAGSCGRQILYLDRYLVLAAFAAWFVYLVVWMHTASLDEAGTLVDMRGAPATVQNVRQGKLKRYLWGWCFHDILTVVVTFAGDLHEELSLDFTWIDSFVQVFWLFRSWTVYRTRRAHRLKASNESLDDEGVDGAAPPPIVVGTVIGQEQDAYSSSLHQGQGVASADVPSGIVISADVPSGNDMESNKNNIVDNAP